MYIEEWKIDETRLISLQPSVSRDPLHQFYDSMRKQVDVLVP